MSSKMVAQSGKFTLGGVICTPDGTVKQPIDLNASVPDKLRRRFPPLPFPCELQHTTLSRDVICNALVDLFDVGSLNAQGRIRLYTTGFLDLLSTVFMAQPSFGASVSGVAEGLTLPWSDSAAIAPGTASKFELIDRDENLILTGDVAPSGAEILFPQTEIQVNDIVKILSASYTAAP